MELSEHKHRYRLSQQSNGLFLLTCCGALIQKGKEDIPCQDTMTIGQMNEKLNEVAQLESSLAEAREEKGKLWDDLAAWLSLAKRQYKEMPHNEPLCPTKAGIEKTERLLGIK